MRSPARHDDSPRLSGGRDGDGVVARRQRELERGTVGAAWVPWLVETAGVIRTAPGLARELEGAT